MMARTQSWQAIEAIRKLLVDVNRADFPIRLFLIRIKRLLDEGNVLDQTGGLPVLEDGDGMIGFDRIRIAAS